jgi:uncharacterized protein (TIGR00290 family)
MPPPKAWIAWSTGKDSAWALVEARREGAVEVTGLLPTVTRTYGRVSMHGVREELLEQQALAVGLPLHRVSIAALSSEEEYEAAMSEAMSRARSEGVTRVVFGDIFLEDVRAYREERLARAGMEAVFPLWGRDTGALAREMMEGGLEARVTCVDPARAPRAIAGTSFDERLLAELPEGADPCGERGEFHTFAWDGPSFLRPVGVTVGETVEREGFVFTDLLPAS